MNTIEVKTKKAVGTPRIDEKGTQSNMLGFRVNPGSMEVWNSYAKNLNLDNTELFYQMLHHLANQGNFIIWFETNLPGETEKNKDWIEGWKLISKCAENMLMLNKGRIKRADLKPLETKLTKMVRETLDEHFKKQQE